MVLELLRSDMTETAYTRDSELDRWSSRLGLGPPRFIHHIFITAGDRCIVDREILIN